jgi:hypothetical protein
MHCGTSEGSFNSTTMKMTCGAPNIAFNASAVAAAANMAAAAEFVVLVVGSGTLIAAEGHDATNISMPDGQSKLIAAVAAAAKLPVVVVTITASALELATVLRNDKVGAVVHAGEPADSSLGIADILFGKRVPAGRMVQTIYPDGWQNSVSILDMGMRPGPSDFPRPDCPKPREGDPPCPNATNLGRTHRFFTGNATVPFGFGLSFTSFSYKLSAATSSGAAGTVSLDGVRSLLARHVEARPFPPQHETDALGAVANHTITVTNTGAIDADDVVLGFVKAPGAGLGGVPLQSLYDFRRVFVPAGKSVDVTLASSALDFTQVDAGGVRRALPGVYTFQFGIPETSQEGQGFATAQLAAA